MSYFTKIIVDKRQRRELRQYESNLVEMGIEKFEPQVLQVMHQIKASNLIIEKYDQDTQSRLKN